MSCVCIASIVYSFCERSLPLSLSHCVDFKCDLRDFVLGDLGDEWTHIIAVVAHEGCALVSARNFVQPCCRDSENKALV